MREKLEHIKIRHKIIIIFLGLLILTTIFTLGISWHGSQKDAERQMREMSDQTLNALDNSLQLIVKQVEQGSYTIFWNPVVQDILSQIGDGEPDPTTRSTVEESLINMMLSGDYISSIILYDEYGNSYDCVRSGRMVKNTINIEDMLWYDEAEAMDGEFIFVPNSGLASFLPEENVLSMIKVIKSRDDYSELGIVAVNIAESVIRQYFEEIGGEHRQGQTQKGHPSDGPSIFKRLKQSAHIRAVYSSFFTTFGSSRPYFFRRSSALSRKLRINARMPNEENIIMGAR